MKNKNFVNQAVVAIFIALMLLNYGCTSKDIRQIFLMPAPDVYDDGTITPFTDTNPIENIPYRGILYATDRKPAGEDDEEPSYLSERGHLLRMGTARIQSGEEGITWEEARRISLLKTRSDKYPLRVGAVEEIGILDRSINVFMESELIPAEPHLPAQQFAEMVDAKLALSKKKDIYIYVHGYKVTFENPLLVATELWHFLGYDGVFIAYAWPATPSTLAYLSDIETAMYSARNLRLFLEYLAEETNTERIHILGYSAGTRVVIDALAQLSHQRKCLDKKAFEKRLPLGHIILTGSDYDRQILAMHLQDGLFDMLETLTIYLSGSDKALGMSNLVFGRRRLGQSFDGQKIQQGAIEYLRKNKKLIIINVTDAADADAGNGHGYFRSSPWVSSDILMTLMYDLIPEDRGVVLDDELPIWIFPDNYIQRLRTKLKEHLQGF